MYLFIYAKLIKNNDYILALRIYIYLRFTTLNIFKTLKDKYLIFNL